MTISASCNFHLKAFTHWGCSYLVRFQACILIAFFFLSTTMFDSYCSQCEECIQLYAAA